MKDLFKALSIVGWFIATGSLLALSLRECGTGWTDRENHERAAREVFMKQCKVDGNTFTDCWVLWEQIK